MFLRHHGQDTQVILEVWRSIVEEFPSKHQFRGRRRRDKKELLNNGHSTYFTLILHIFSSFYIFFPSFYIFSSHSTYFPLLHIPLNPTIFFLILHSFPHPTYIIPLYLISPHSTYFPIIVHIFAISLITQSSQASRTFPLPPQPPRVLPQHLHLDWSPSRPGKSAERFAERTIFVHLDSRCVRPGEASHSSPEGAWMGMWSRKGRGIRGKLRCGSGLEGWTWGNVEDKIDWRT